MFADTRLGWRDVSGDQRDGGLTVRGGWSVFCLSGRDEMRSKINQGAHMPSHDPLVSDRNVDEGGTCDYSL